MIRPRWWQVWRRWFRCRHRHVVRERRPLDDGVAAAPMVMHFVCLDCDVAWPMVDRTWKEHYNAQERLRPPPAARRGEP